jgi:hypothetical protein
VPWRLMHDPQPQACQHGDDQPDAHLGPSRCSLSRETQHPRRNQNPHPEQEIYPFFPLGEFESAAIATAPIIMPLTHAFGAATWSDVIRTSFSGLRSRTNFGSRFGMWILSAFFTTLTPLGNRHKAPYQLHDHRHRHLRITKPRVSAGFVRFSVIAGLRAKIAAFCGVDR